MQKIKQLYRKDYLGEEVVRDLVWSENSWNQTREYVPNNVINEQISNQAVIIGNGISRLELDRNLFNLLRNHKAGLMATKAVQTYGCNALYRDFNPDFLVANGPEITQEIAASGYCANEIVYSTQNAVLDYPGKFYLTPQNPHWDAGTIAAYLSCFDGHKKVYLLGFDANDGGTQDNYNVYAGTNGYGARGESPNTEEFSVRALELVMQTYSDVEFVRVMPQDSYYTPDRWKYQVNFRQIGWRDFVIEVDL
jgi:hypothetical protein